MNNRVVLIEFVIVDRFHCGIGIPYINGILKRRGIKTIYLRVGLLAKSALDFQNRVRIDKEGKDNIIEILKKSKKLDLLFSHLPSEDFIRNIKRYTDGIYFIESFDGSKANINEFYKRYNIDERYLFNESPDFSFSNINNLAKNFRPLPHLILYDECNYKRSVKSNCFYRNINLSNLCKIRGCSFCINPDINKIDQWNNERVGKHILAAIKTTPWRDFRKRLRIIGEIVINRIDEFFDIILSEKINNTDFLFNFRVDNFIRNRHKIKEALKRISKTDNRLYLALTGIENFSNVELERYNKGIRNYDIFRFLSIIFQLKYNYPHHFDYSEYGGFSLILFNPFTRIEDLRLNYHLIKYLNIEQLCGKLFTSRIRLYKELPFFYLAKKSDLIANKYKEKIFDTASQNFYKKEIPWKYKDRRVEDFNKFLLVKRVNNIDLAIRKLDKIYNNKAFTFQSDVKRLEDMSIEVNIKADAILMKKYKRRKAGKIEIESREEAENIKIFAEKYFRYVKIVENKSGISGPKFSLFYSNSESWLDRSIEVTKMIESGLKKNKESKTYKIMGDILGYPSCCNKYYAENRHYMINYYLYSQMYLRYKENVISPYLNPFALLFFIPCSLNCENAENLIRLKADIKGKLKINWYNNYLKYPFIFLLPFDPSTSTFRDNMGYVVVKPEGEVGDEFSYKPLFYSGDDKRLGYILNSDRLVMKDGFMELYRGKKHIHTFCAEANVWYYKKPLDYEFWKEFTEAYYNSILYGHRFQDNKVGIVDDDFRGIIKKINKNISLIDKHGFTLLDLAQERNVLIANLVSKDKRVQLRVQRVNETENYYKKGQNYVISIGQSTGEIDLDQIAEIMLSIIENE